MKLVVPILLLLGACDRSSGLTDGSALVDGGSVDLASSNSDLFPHGDLSVQGTADMDVTTGDLATTAGCSMSCGATQVCVWLTCPSTPTPFCVDVSSACKLAPSCGCLNCPVGSGNCTSHLGQLACGPPGTCG